MRLLDGKWAGIVGGTNIGKASAGFSQSGVEVSGRFTFHDILTVPLGAEVRATLSGPWLEGTLSDVSLSQAPPPGTVWPTAGRILCGSVLQIGILSQDTSGEDGWVLPQKCVKGSERVTKCQAEI